MEKELKNLTIKELHETKNYYYERKEHLGKDELEYLKKIENELLRRRFRMIRK